MLQNGKQVIKPIGMGLNDGKEVEVTSGLSAGDEVITGTGAATTAATTQAQGRQNQPRGLIGGF